MMTLHRMLVFGGGGGRVSYAAQDVVGASRMWKTQLWSVLERSGLVEAEGLQLRRSIGDTGITSRRGGSLSVLTSAPTAGHGMTVELAIIDEAMSLVNDDREQALLPTLRTVADGQLWVISTAGDERSTYLYGKVRRGRERLAKGGDSQVAFFEWGAPTDADWTDEEVWRSAVPALGHTVDLRVLRHEFETMEPAEFRRACLNQWPTRSTDPVIDWPVWERACSQDAAPSGELVLAVDAPPDRSSACLVVAGGGSLEVVQQRKGVDWVLDDIRELHAANRFVSVVCAKSSPASAFVEQLRGFGVPAQVVDWGFMADACGKFSDDVESRSVRLRQDPRLDSAMLGAVRKPYAQGAKFTWWRDFRMLDISPLWAATLAHFVSWRHLSGAAVAEPQLLAVGAGPVAASDRFQESVERWRSLWEG